MSRQAGFGVRLLGALIMVIALSACSAAPQLVARPSGGVRLVMASDRQVQFSGSLLAGLKVTITNQTTHQASSNTYPSNSLVSGKMSFEADNLLPGSYAARIDAFADAQQTVNVGTSTSSVFVVAANGTTQVSMPALTLASTPLATWKINVKVTLPSGYRVKKIDWGLDPLDDSLAATQSLNTTSNNITRTWSNVPAFSSAASTASALVTASKSGRPDLVKGGIVTVALTAGATTTTTLNVAL